MIMCIYIYNRHLEVSQIFVTFSQRRVPLVVRMVPGQDGADFHGWSWNWTRAFPSALL